MTNNNRTCIVCGKSYKYCSNCAEYSNLEIWHNIFHDANCKEIYNAVSMYGKVSKEETKARLDKCNLSNKSNFHKNIVKVIDEIYAVQEQTSTIVVNEPEIINENVDDKTKLVSFEVEEKIQEEPIRVNTAYKKFKR